MYTDCETGTNWPNVHSFGFWKTKPSGGGCCIILLGITQNPLMIFADKTKILENSFEVMEDTHAGYPEMSVKTLTNQ